MASHPQVNGHKRTRRPQGKSRSEAPPSRTESRRQAEQPSQRTRSAFEVAAGALVRAGNVQGRTQGALAEQRRQMAGRVSVVRDVLRGASEHLRGEHEGAARYLDRAGRKAEEVAHYIGNADLRTLRGDAERLARAKPALFVGGALVAGLVLGRLFKASGPSARSEDPEGSGGASA